MVACPSCAIITTEKGRFLLVYEKKALGKRASKRTGKLVPSGLPIEIATQITWEAIRQVRIVPRADGYMVEVVYEQELQPAAVNPELRAAVDVGVNVLAAITSDKPGFVPRLVSGKPPKASISTTTKSAPSSSNASRMRTDTLHASWIA